MRVMSYNTLFGGFDGSDDRRYRTQMEIIRAADPDVLLVQEAKGFLDAGSQRLFETEHHLGRRGFIAPAPITGQNTAIFVRPGIEPVSFESDAHHFHHAAAIARLRIPGYRRPLTAISVHLCPNGAEVRLREASYLLNYAVEDEYVVVAGDFNSVSPNDPEPEGLDALPARFRARYSDLSGKADRRTVAALLQAGFVDVAVQLRKNTTPTVPGAGFKNTEFVPFRSDYLLVTPALADLVADYEVIRNPFTDTASDHYPLIATFRSKT